MSWKTASAILVALVSTVSQQANAGFINVSSATTASAFQTSPVQFDNKSGVSNTSSSLTASVAQANASVSSTITPTDLTFNYTQDYNALGFAQSAVTVSSVFSSQTDTTFSLTTYLNQVGSPGFSSSVGSLVDSTTSTVILTTLAPNTTYTGVLLAGHVYNLIYSNTISGLSGAASVQGSVSIQETPEPATLAILATGLPILAGYGWRLRRRQQNAAEMMA